jgi:hypothetical protein
MTIEEKREDIQRYCFERDCNDCKLRDFVGLGSCFSDATDEEIEKNYAFLLGKTPEETASAIDHPSHYAGEKYECIEVMREVFGEEATKHFCICNAFKYLWRCGKKHESPDEDIKKAIWYLNKYLATKEENA